MPDLWFVSDLNSSVFYGIWIRRVFWSELDALKFSVFFQFIFLALEYVVYSIWVQVLSGRIKAIWQEKWVQTKENQASSKNFKKNFFYVNKEKIVETTKKSRLGGASRSSTCQSLSHQSPAQTRTDSLLSSIASTDKHPHS